MKLVPLKVTRLVASQALKAEKHAPTILFVAGVTGAVASTVLACRSTLRLGDVLIEAEERLEEAKNEEADGKKLTFVYMNNVASVGKLYAPAIVVGGLSVAALTKSHNILNRRNTALVATVTTLQRAFDEYRARVADELGEEKEREIRYAGAMTDVDKVNLKTGEVKTVQEMRATNLDASPFAVFFGPDNENWSVLPEYNIMFLRVKQNWLNDKLKAQGHLLLNDAYDALGFDRTYEGSIIGWKWGHNPRNDKNDQYVDFGCFTDSNRDMIYEFLTGKRGEILVDFNYDGQVNDLIGK